LVTDEDDHGTIDLFSNFAQPPPVAKTVVAKSTTKKEPEKKLTGSLVDSLDLKTPPKKSTVKNTIPIKPYFSEDDGDEIAPVIPKRDLCESDRGWHREFIPNLNDHAYMSNSRVKQILTSMQHFNWRYILGHKSEDTDAKRMGRIIHLALLEPDKFRSRFQIIPKFSGEGSMAAKAEYIGGLPDDAIILKQKEVDKILYMTDSVSNHPKAAQVLAGGHYELNGYVWDERRKVWWLFKPDVLKSAIVADLKSSKSADPESFSRDIFNFGYYLQVPIYLDGASALLGRKIEQFPFVVVENCEPYVTEVYYVTPELIEIGRNLVDLAIDKYHHHMNEYAIAKEKNQKYYWPGYTGKAAASQINIPTWAQYRLEAIVETHEG